MDQDDTVKISEHEAIYVLTAYNRHEKFLATDGCEYCSHSHEKDFLYQHNTLICDTDQEMKKSCGVLNLLCVKLKNLARNKPSLRHQTKDFLKELSFMNYGEALLWCANLLIDFHKKDECHEYLNLALAFKLVAYWRVRYSAFINPHDFIDTMMEFLRYISLYKCKHALFMLCLNNFLLNFDFVFRAEDYLFPVLVQVLEKAHELRFNFFRRYCVPHFIIQYIEYIRWSLYRNVKRFLILAINGYEDEFTERSFYDYKFFVRAKDKDDLFDDVWDNLIQDSSRNFRSVQVLFLYIQATSEENESDKIYNDALYMLWETIPDPYLTQHQFLSSFRHSNENPRFLDVWEWYAKVVCRNESPEYTPRPLKHLARCAVRRSLTECAELPYGIQSLEIPSTLKIYLKLEDSFSIETLVKDLCPG